MDAIQDIVRHPFYRPREKFTDIIFKSNCAIWDLVDEINDSIERYGLTKRIVRPGQDYAHYRECHESQCEDCTKHDSCGLCVCQRVSYKQFQVMQLLNELERLNGGGVGNGITRLKRWLSR